MLQHFDERNRNLIVNVNGRLVHRDEAGVSPFDSVVQGGDAVWEGLRLYDGHDDGWVCEPHLLGLRFEDLDRDGVLDLVIEGDAIETESPNRGRSRVRARVRIDPTRGVLVLLDQEGSCAVGL